MKNIKHITKYNYNLKNISNNRRSIVYYNIFNNSYIKEYFFRDTIKLDYIAKYCNNNYIKEGIFSKYNKIFNVKNLEYKIGYRKIL